MDEHSTTKTKLSDILLAMHDYLSNEHEHISDKKYIFYHNKLVKYLSLTLLKLKLPNIRNFDDASNLVMSYLYGKNKKDDNEKSQSVGLLLKSPGELEAKTQISYLVKDLIRESAKSNKEGYELSVKIYSAIRVLEDKGVIIRDAASQGKYLSKITHLKLASAPDRPASYDDYQNNAHKVGQYKTLKRGGSVNKSSIITLGEAQELVMELLEAFNGWVSIENLQRAAYKHTPEQMRIIKVMDMKKDSAANETNAFDMLGKITEDDYIQDFYNQQAEKLVKEKSEQIWKMVCEITKGDELFCLYYIPNRFQDNKTDQSPNKILEDFGSSSTINDRNKKLDKIWKDELQSLPGVKGYFRVDAMQNRIVFDMGIGILINLHHRCTEIGCNPHLQYDGKEIN